MDDEPQEHEGVQSWTDHEQFTRRLPPRPDPQTGAPFPPHGRCYLGGDRTSPEKDKNRETRLAHRPEPPPGQGPVLAWHRESRKGKWTGFLWSVLIMTSLAELALVLEGDPLALFTRFWPGWIVIVVFSYLMSDPFGYWCYSAGADWVQIQRSRWEFTRRHYITLYDLGEIDVGYGGPTDFHLYLRNSERGLSCRFEELQRDRRIWDLVYNGILHSVANGAKVSNVAIGTLELGETPALRLRRTWEIRHGLRD